MNNQQLETWFQQFEEDLICTANDIFNHPETAYQERESSHILAAFLEKQGFQIEWNIAGLETAFLATWGTNTPVLGFLAEYDALPGLGHPPTTSCTLLPGAGHGCGHNLLGTAVAGAACAVKHYLQQTGQTAQLLVYGCPAEEIMDGKIVMNKAGVFDNLDAAITWHPFDRNRISNDIWQAQDIKNYHFYGRAAHASKFPELGRSSLDAAELMNIGVNYLREHVSDDVRMHYAYTSAVQPANVVPDYTATNYFIRSAKRARTEDASRRVDDCAKGAALMTGTKVEVELVSSCKEMKVNRVLAETFYEAMTQIPLPAYTNAELEFAVQLSKTAGIDNQGILFTGLEPLEPEPVVIAIGTDVSEVSHTVPTITISAATMCKGTPLHHWSATAQSGMSIGHKGMLYAARCMALGSVALIDDASYLKLAWEEHEAN